MDVRPIRPSDEEAYLDILNRTSLDDRYFRFFHAVDHFEHEDLVPFVERRPDTLGFIAETDGRAVGAAHAFIDGDHAEIAVVVAADARLHGVGHELLARLISRLQARAIRTIVAYSLVENAGFGRLATSLGMRPSRKPGDGGVVTWTLPLGPRQPTTMPA